VLQAVATERIGVAAMVLGAGRERVDDVIDPAVGLTMAVRIGDAVNAGDPLATLHYNRERSNGEALAERAEALLREALSWSAQPADAPPLVYEILR
jgi:pyrimidine-nucleoside phosphorylase